MIAVASVRYLTEYGVSEHFEYHSAYHHVQQWCLLPVLPVFPTRVSPCGVGLFLTSTGVLSRPSKMRLLLFYTHLLVYSTITVVFASGPVAVDWSSKSYGPEGPWQVTDSIYRQNED